MRNRTEALKYLSARSANLSQNMTTGGKGGEFGWENVAGALAHLDKPARVYTEIKYSTPGSATETLKMVDQQIWLQDYALYKYVVPMSIKEDWSSSGNSILPKISKAALAESLGVKTVHRKCGGRGWYMEPEQLKPVKCTCDNGYQQYTLKRISKSLGLDHQFFARSAWRSRYMSVLGYYNDMENRLIEVLHDNM